MKIFPFRFFFFFFVSSERFDFWHIIFTNPVIKILENDSIRQTLFGNDSDFQTAMENTRVLINIRHAHTALIPSKSDGTLICDVL